MAKLREQLEKLANLFRSTERKLEVAGNRWQKNHDLAHREHKAQKETEREIKRLQQNHAPIAHIQNLQAKAARQKHRASKAHDRALYFVGKAKDFAAELHDLKETRERKEDKLHKLEISHGPHLVSPNKAAGGADKQRLEFCMHQSELHGSQYYSQEGPADIHHGIDGPSSGHRHDCSSWATSMFFSAGLPDPNGGDYASGETMFTGTLGEHGESVSESQLDTGCAILYGTAPFHHIELKDGPMSDGPWTVGHGSAPIDRGVVALLPGPRAYRRYIK